MADDAASFVGPAMVRERLAANYLSRSEPAMAEQLWAEHGWGLGSSGAAAIVAGVLCLALAMQLIG